MKRKITLMLLTLICETPIYNMYMEEVDIFCDNSKRKKRLTEGINVHKNQITIASITCYLHIQSK